MMIFCNIWGVVSFALICCLQNGETDEGLNLHYPAVTVAIHMEVIDSPNYAGSLLFQNQACSVLILGLRSQIYEHVQKRDSRRRCTVLYEVKKPLSRALQIKNRGYLPATPAPEEECCAIKCS